MLTCQDDNPAEDRDVAVLVIEVSSLYAFVGQVRTIAHRKVRSVHRFIQIFSTSSENWQETRLENPLWTR